jgi:hypothetical protein
MTAESREAQVAPLSCALDGWAVPLLCPLHGSVIRSGWPSSDRIVAEDAGTGFTTRGDHNSYTDPWHPTPADIVGAPVMTLSGVGNAIGFVRQPIVAAMVASLLTIAWLFHRRRAQPKGVDPASVGAHSREPSDVGYNPA